MIAASNPQEFVPRGRQQALNHPGPLSIELNPDQIDDDQLLSRLQKFTLSDLENSTSDDNKSENEWWVLRKASTDFSGRFSFKQSNQICLDIENCFSSNFNESCLVGAAEGGSAVDNSSNTSAGKRRRSSDQNSRLWNKRLSVESDRNAEKDVQNSGLPQRNVGGIHLRTRVDYDYMEDELYVKGNTVIWSQGLNPNNSIGSNGDNSRKTIISYTFSTPIKHALWSTFYYERPTYYQNLLDSNQKIDQPNGNAVPAICIADEQNIRVYTPKGEDFAIAVPFIVGRMWNTKFGLLIEKENGGQKSTFYEHPATLYSLAHPLDDICPVAINNYPAQSQNDLQLLNNDHIQIVFTSESPSICMVYDDLTKLHSVYRIRKLKSIERDVFDKTFRSTVGTTNSALDNSIKLKNRLSIWENLVNVAHTATPSSASKVTTGSFSHLNSRSYSSMAAISRCQSPAVSSLGGSNSWLIHSTSRLQNQLQMPSTSNDRPTPVTNRSFFDCSKSMSHLKSKPTICLDHLWTTQEGNSAGCASKAFLSDDLTGQWYLCYILPSKYQLFMVRLDFTSVCLNFGLVTSISAKDAVPVPHLHMLAILEHNGNVNLYSGLTLIGKLHIGGTLVQHTPSPFVKRNLNQFQSPFPRRSSLLPHCQQSDPRFDEHLISPVLPATPMIKNLAKNKLARLPDQSDQIVQLCGLTDAIENRLTLKYSDGSFYRITLPELATSTLVENCLNALRQCLQRDAFLTFISRWYACRNVLGTEHLNKEQEWQMFSQLLYELLGYEDDSPSDEQLKDNFATPATSVKRKKPSSQGTDADWAYLVKSNSQRIDTNLGLVMENDFESSTNKIGSINSKSILFPYIKQIHYVFHLLYEDLKLNTLRWDDLNLLVSVVGRLASDLKFPNYVRHYFMDFPHCNFKPTIDLLETNLKLINGTSGNTDYPFNVFQQIQGLLKGDLLLPYPYLADVNNRSRDIVQFAGILGTRLRKERKFESSFVKDMNSDEVNLLSFETNENVAEKIVIMMVEMGIDSGYLNTLPVGIYYILYDVLWSVREAPPTNWPTNAYKLIGREDLACHVEKSANLQDNFATLGMYSHSQLQEMPAVKEDATAGNLDGMEDIDPANNPLMKLRFAEDVRVLEARKMLQSSKPVPIVLEQRPDVSDHDFIEEQEKHLYAICTRTMALPVGRGMFTLRTATPVVTEPLVSPTLCLTGKAPPLGTTVDLSHIDTPSQMCLWPLFHNGVANGLRITPDAHNIDSQWITFNRPKSGIEQQMDHAGFLMALGLNGHLKNLAVSSTYDYLLKSHEMTSVGVLLGLSAAFRGTSNANLTKILSIHVEALLPPTSMELDVPQTMQVASLLGIGLLYQRTAHRHMTEVLLSEIGRPPGPEMENSVDRESYSLAAGLALGMVMLQFGGHPAGLADLNVPDILHYYMVGGNRRPLTGAQREKYRVPSFQIREGSTVNLDVTAPGATLALGLMYLGTNNKAVADWMSPPDTHYLLDFIRPDFLMLRTLSRNLILWDSIVPSKEWVESQVPDTILPYCMVKPTYHLDIDYEAMNQAYCNIVTGACFALALRYAGTADQDAFDTLLYFCHMFTSLTGKSIAELAGKPTIETCLNMLLISAAMVMAGTGNLDIMRLVRHLRRRVGVGTSAVVTYGSHLAIHMALGLLFIGGGRYTLSNSPSSVAALICAFYPKFPTHTSDNRYHLQAFRHLYVLAAEPRLLIPKDVNLDRSCYANLEIVTLNGKLLKNRGPGLIPDLSTLAKVSIADERYWPVVFERGRNWDMFMKMISTSGYIEVKQRAGCLSYIVDKLGYHNELARTLTQSESIPWDPSPNGIISFTSDKTVKYFCDHFLISDSNLPDCTEQQRKAQQMLTKITYEAAVKDKLVVVMVFANILKMLTNMEKGHVNNFNLWQYKLMENYVMQTQTTGLFDKETIIALRQELEAQFDPWLQPLNHLLTSYLSGTFDCHETNQLMEKELNWLCAIVVFYDLPFNCVTAKSPLELAIKLRQSNYGAENVARILQVCKFF